MCTALLPPGVNPTAVKYIIIIIIIIIIISTEQKASWTPDRVWTIWRRQKTLAPAGNQTKVPRLPSP
jgi:hypothetical protein